MSKEKQRDLIKETMEPLRQVYQDTNWQHRKALEVLVLQALRSP